MTRITPTDREHLTRLLLHLRRALDGDLSGVRTDTSTRVPTLVLNPDAADAWDRYQITRKASTAPGEDEPVDEPRDQRATTTRKTTGRRRGGKRTATTSTGGASLWHPSASRRTPPPSSG